MYARILRKWSLTKFRMYLWMPVLILLVSCCQNVTSMHLSTNIKEFTSILLSPTTSSREVSSSEVSIHLDNSRQINDNHRRYMNDHQQINSNNKNININNNNYNNNNNRYNKETEMAEPYRNFQDYTRISSISHNNKNNNYNNIPPSITVKKTSNYDNHHLHPEQQPQEDNQFEVFIRVDDDSVVFPSVKDEQLESAAEITTANVAEYSNVPRLSSQIINLDSMTSNSANVLDILSSRISNSRRRDSYSSTSINSNIDDIKENINDNNREFNNLREHTQTSETVLPISSVMSTVSSEEPYKPRTENVRSLHFQEDEYYGNEEDRLKKTKPDRTEMINNSNNENEMRSRIYEGRERVSVPLPSNIVDTNDRSFLPIPISLIDSNRKKSVKNELISTESVSHISPERYVLKDPHSNNNVNIENDDFTNYDQNANAANNENNYRQFTEPYYSQRKHHSRRRQRQQDRKSRKFRRLYRRRRHPIKSKGLQMINENPLSDERRSNPLIKNTNPFLSPFSEQSNNDENLESRKSEIVNYDTIKPSALLLSPRLTSGIPSLIESKDTLPPLSRQQRQQIDFDLNKLMIGRNRRDSRSNFQSYSHQTLQMPERHSQSTQDQHHGHNNHFRSKHQVQHQRQSRKSSKIKRYCSARDPAQLAFEAPTVFEGKVISMSPFPVNFSATFSVNEVFKKQLGSKLPDLLRLQFTHKNSTGECDIYREYLRPRGIVSERLEQGHAYILFVQQIHPGNFTILGQPMKKTDHIVKAVKKGVSENYAQPASIRSLTANNTNVTDGEELRIVCKVRGQPPPKVTWFKDDKSINRNRKLYQFIHLRKRSELVVKSFNSTYAGKYECRAKNKVIRKPERCTINIEAASRSLGDNTYLSGDECGEGFRTGFCLNGGTCRYFIEIGQPSCVCPEGYDGDRCHLKQLNSLTPHPTFKTGYMADDPVIRDSDEDDEDEGDVD